MELAKYFLRYSSISNKKIKQENLMTTQNKKHKKDEKVKKAKELLNELANLELDDEKLEDVCEGNMIDTLLFNYRTTR